MHNDPDPRNWVQDEVGKIRLIDFADSKTKVSVRNKRDWSNMKAMEIEAVLMELAH